MTARGLPPAEVAVVEGPAGVAERAAKEVLAVLREALERRPRARWVLSGGSTPRRLYEKLASRPGALDWGRVELFWGDERCVEPESRESNFALARETLLSGLPLAAGGVHRVHGEDPPAAAARRYAGEVEAALATGPFDLDLLGLGADGHVASLFPGSPATPPGVLVAPVTAPVEPRRRITLTPAALRRCRRLIYLVAGRDKAPAVARALDPGGDDGRLSERVRPADGRTLWVIDRAAAGELAG